MCDYRKKNEKSKILKKLKTLRLKRALKKLIVNCPWVFIFLELPIVIPSKKLFFFFITLALAGCSYRIRG
jgi:hypothetical protein